MKEAKRMGRTSWPLAFGVVGLMLLGTGALAVDIIRPRSVTPQPKELPLPAKLLTDDNAPSLGSLQATVSVVEFSEFECPFCGRFARDIFPEIANTFVATGKVRWLFRHMPLEGLHRNAFSAAVVATCAHKQGHFWDVHDYLFASQSRLPQLLAVPFYHPQVDNDSIRTCISNEGSSFVRTDMRLGESLGVTGTPSFFIGVNQAVGRIRILDAFAGAPSVAVFSERLNAALKVVASR